MTSSPAREQGSDEQATVDLGRNEHHAWILRVLSDKLVESPHSLDTLGQARRRKTPIGVVFDEHVVMAFAPVVADEHFAIAPPDRGSISNRRPPAAC